MPRELATKFASEYNLKADNIKKIFTEGKTQMHI